MSCIVYTSHHAYLNLPFPDVPGDEGAGGGDSCGGGARGCTHGVGGSGRFRRGFGGPRVG